MECSGTVSYPRPVVPGTTYLISRRCAQRRFRLRPSKLTNQTYEYLLAVAAKRFDMKLHALCVMSNHTHIVVTDPGAQLPRFMQYLNSLVARALNASLGCWESFWGPPTYSAVALGDADTIVAKIAYCITNPVAQGLVCSSAEWPGLVSLPDELGNGVPRVVERPDNFFSPRGSMPATARLEFTVPAGFESAEEFRARVKAAVAEQEEQERERIKRDGGKFLGPAKVLAQSPWGRPKSKEPRRGLNPRVAGRDKWRRIEAIAQLKTFWSEYREALARFCDGDHTVVFPAGTYLMRVRYGVPCAASP